MGACRSLQGSLELLLKVEFIFTPDPVSLWICVQNIEALVDSEEREGQWVCMRREAGGGGFTGEWEHVIILRQHHGLSSG